MAYVEIISAAAAGALPIFGDTISHRFRGGLQCFVPPGLPAALKHSTPVCSERLRHQTESYEFDTLRRKMLIEEGFFSWEEKYIV